MDSLTEGYGKSIKILPIKTTKVISGKYVDIEHFILFDEMSKLYYGKSGTWTPSRSSAFLFAKKSHAETSKNSVIDEQCRFLRKSGVVNE
jgi:hypothetical protein